MANTVVLNERQKAFCEHYVIDLNATQSAIRAGYDPTNARQQGYQVLAKPQVKAEIKRLRKALSKESGIDKNWVIRRAKEISDKCMQAEPVMIFDGEQWVESGEYKFDSAGANKATEMLGKIIGVFEKDNGQKSIVMPVIIDWGTDK